MLTGTATVRILPRTVPISKTCSTSESTRRRVAKLVESKCADNVVEMTVN